MFYINILRSFLFVFFIITYEVNASETQQPSYEFCKKLMQEAMEYTNQKKYPQAIEKLLKVKLITEEKLWKDLLLDINLNLGNNFYYLSDFGEALNYYQKTLDIIQKDKNIDKKKACVPLMNIAILYGKNNNFEESFLYFKKAYDLVENDKNSVRKKQLAYNMAEIYLDTNQIQAALDILNETKEDVEVPLINFMWNSVYTKALFADGRIEEAKKNAQQLYSKLIEENHKDFRDMCYTCITSVMSDIYKELKQADSAVYFLRQTIIHTDKIKNYIKAYEDLSEIYIQQNDIKTALKYKDSVIFAKDSLHKNLSISQYEASKIKFNIWEYQNELFREKERKKRNELIYLIIVLSFLIIIFSAYRRLKNNIIKQKQRAIIANLELEKEKKEHLLAKEQLKGEVAEKNRELTAKALFVANRNQTIKEIVNSIESDRKQIENKEMFHQISIIKALLKSDEQKDDFMRHFENVNPFLIKRLKQKHPKLTSNDTRFLCYIFMNLSLKEISKIFNITYDACVFRKKRIIDKLGFDKNKISLYDYLLSISS